MHTINSERVCAAQLLGGDVRIGPQTCHVHAKLTIV